MHIKRGYGRIADGVEQICYFGDAEAVAPCPVGLLISSPEGELVLTNRMGEVAILGHVNGQWQPRKQGVACLEEGRFYLIGYDGVKSELFAAEEVPGLRCSQTGLVLNLEWCKWLHVPFNGSTPKVFWDRPGTNAVVDDGLVIGSVTEGSWLHVPVEGEPRTVYEDGRLRKGSVLMQGLGYILAKQRGVFYLYPWDGTEPAQAPTYQSFCHKGLVDYLKNVILLFPFGGGNPLIWEVEYDQHLGNCLAGIILNRGEEIVLLPYETCLPSQKLWQGGFGELDIFDEAVIFNNQGEVIMIPLSA